MPSQLAIVCHIQTRTTIIQYSPQCIPPDWLRPHYCCGIACWGSCEHLICCMIEGGIVETVYYWNDIFLEYTQNTNLRRQIQADTGRHMHIHRYLHTETDRKQAQGGHIVASCYSNVSHTRSITHSTVQQYNSPYMVTTYTVIESYPCTPLSHALWGSTSIVLWLIAVIYCLYCGYVWL